MVTRQSPTIISIYFFILTTFSVVNLYILTFKKHGMEIKSFFLSICFEIVLDSQEL